MSAYYYDRDGASRSDIALRSYRDKEYEEPREQSTLHSLPKGTARKPEGSWWHRQSRGRQLLFGGALLLVVVVVIAVAVPVSITHSSNKSAAASETTGSSSDTPSGTTSAPAGVPTGATGTDWKTAAVGGDGSLVYREDGTSFVYNNLFGGFWNAIPFNDSARAQADVPALEDTWDFNNDRINGVNIGGWLTIEPFIVPSLFEPYNQGAEVNFNATVIDEWSLSEALGTNLSTVIENHYATFITEEDFAQIAGAGLNWVRLPIPYWLIEVYDGEPFLANVGWTYLLKGLAWARKYGLRVNLDLHAVPGSQNGYNHSSKQGTINFLSGVMGVANAQRTLNYIRTLAEFISQDEYKNVVPMFSILNEPLASSIGVDTLRTFYIEAYNMIRNDISGIGAGAGPYIVFHDGFVTQQPGVTLASNVSAGGWGGFMTGADRIILDSHPYLCFSTPNNDGLSYQAAKPCTYWANTFNASKEEFGPTVAGEWSLAVNDCGKWLNNVGNGQRFEGTYYAPGNTTAPMYAGIGSCTDWNNYASYNSSWKSGFQLIAEGHQSAFRDWFFWTWKTGYSTALGMVANPLWNYQLALENGYMPSNPRGRLDACTTFVAQQGVTMSTNIAPTYSAWMTGGAGAGTILATDQLSSWSAWPPASIGNTPVSHLPTYTATGEVITMSAATPTSYPSGYSTSANVGDGWAQPTDSASWNVPVSGCTYPNPWSGHGVAVPTAACTGSDSARRMVRRAPRAVPTLPPRPRAA